MKERGKIQEIRWQGKKIRKGRLIDSIGVEWWGKNNDWGAQEKNMWGKEESKRQGNQK